MKELYEIYETINRNINKELELLKKFVAQPSVCAISEGLSDMAHLIGEVLENLGFKVKFYDTQTGAPIIYAVMNGRSDKTLMFYNHYDVQPPEPLEEWESDPFKPVIKNGKIYGRGVSDNKGNIVARIAAVRAYLETYGELPLTIKFLIEGDEECSSRGFKEFVDRHREMLRAHGCIWESGYLNKEGRLQIYAGMKGILYVELISKGAKRDLHSSMGTIIPNPAWRLVWALSTIKNSNEEVMIDGFYDKVKYPSKEDLEALEKIPFDEEFIKELTGVKEFTKKVSGLELKIEHFFKPTVTIDGLVSGYIGKGSKTVLPSKAIAKMDFRLVPDQDPYEIYDRLVEHLKKGGFTDIEVKLLGAEYPGKSPINTEITNVTVKSAELVYGKPPVLFPITAGSGPFYNIANRLNIPTISAGVGYYDSRAHAPNENIRLEDFKKGIEHIATIIHMFSHVK